MNKYLVYFLVDDEDRHEVIELTIEPDKELLGLDVLDDICDQLKAKYSPGWVEVYNIFEGEEDA